jgi:succinyl-CoA:acetate CoA-transferase
MTQNYRIPSFLSNKITSADNAVKFFKNNMIVGTSGFTKGGDSKVVLKALASHCEENNLEITLVSGASLGHNTDGFLAKSGVLKKRLPFQADAALRKEINSGKVLFIDQHLSESSKFCELTPNGTIDVAVIEVAQILENGELVFTTSVGNNLTFLDLADAIILEVNTKIPLDILGVHDLYLTNKNESKVAQIDHSNTRIGSISAKIDLDKVVAIVEVDIQDEPAEIAAIDPNTKAIANHIIAFLRGEVAKGKMGNSLKPLQCGIGKVANAVLGGFLDSEFENLTMYSEVLQDSTFELIDSGKMKFASASSMTVSNEYFDKIMNNINAYKEKILLRPQNISNASEAIKKLDVIAINTALEFDIYGNVNSTHVMGSNMMNGIGGSSDFARNSYLSIFVTSSIAKEGMISCVVPMVSHVDHTEHDVDILVTEQGLADLRGLAPRERAKVIIENCVHPSYKEVLLNYFERACVRGGQTPHILEEAFMFHTNYMKHGNMIFNEMIIS